MECEGKIPLIQKEKIKSPPIKLSWRNLSYSVRAKNKDKAYEEKQILKPQNGYVKGGEAMFIMGSSGAGKTTLLNALCDRLGRSKKTNLKGEVTLNSTYKVTQKEFGKYGAYVMQDDVLFPFLTCEEVIQYSAKFRLGLQGEELDQKVNEVIDMLGLQQCRSTRIGDQRMKGLSGGERKRTAIGVELITDPQVLFLDEPTSGLDSFNANKIVKILIKQARLGKTVISTIHQPSSSTFAQFDLLLLLMDGHTIYQGPAKGAVDYFDRLGFPTPTYSNPADYFLRKFFVPYKKTLKDKQNINVLIEGYEENILQRIIEQDKFSSTFEEITSQKLNEANSQISSTHELCILLDRTIKNMIRNPLFIKIRLLQTLVIGILGVLVFWKLDNGPKGIQGKISIAFSMSTNQTIAGIFSVVLMFITERPIFLREYANNTYSIWNYFLSKTIVETPLQLIFPILLSLMVYFAVGLTITFERFMIFTLVLIANVLCGTSIGFAIGSFFEDSSMATSISSILILPFIVFAGYFVNLNTVPQWIRWMNYLSPVRYSAEALLRNEMENNDNYLVGEEVFENLGYRFGMWESIAVLLSIALFFRIMAGLGLKLTVSKAQ